VKQKQFFFSPKKMQQSQQQVSAPSSVNVFSTLNQNVTNTFAKTTSTLVNLGQALSTSASALVSGQSVRVNGKEEAAYRSRDLVKSAEDASNKWMQREVEYAKTSAEAYKQTIHEGKLTGSALKPMRESVGGLAMRISVARSVASNLLTDSYSASEDASAVDVLTGTTTDTETVISE
jgi:hypothetical protein